MKILNRIKQISKAYTEGIYADTPANRKLGRVGMSYAEYSNKIKEEKEEQREKKPYYVKLPNSEEFMLGESAISKEKAIELAVDYAKDMVKYNGYKEFKFNLEEDTDNWSNEDINNKKWDWYNIIATKYGNKIEISVYDFNAREYIRNDRQKRERENLLKNEKIEFKLDNFKEKIINDDNQIRLVYSDRVGNKVGDITIFKEPEEKTLYLENIDVAENYRRKGLGRQILKRALQLSDKESNKFNKIELLVDNSDNQFIQNKEEQRKNNKYLIDFYKSEGFEFAGKAEEKELNPTMVKRLKKSFNK